jgi:hypothetical protein
MSVRTGEDEQGFIMSGFSSRIFSRLFGTWEMRILILEVDGAVKNPIFVQITGGRYCYSYSYHWS